MSTIPLAGAAHPAPGTDTGGVRVQARVGHIDAFYLGDEWVQALELGAHGLAEFRATKSLQLPRSAG